MRTFQKVMLACTFFSQYLNPLRHSCFGYDGMNQSVLFLSIVSETEIREGKRLGLFSKAAVNTRARSHGFGGA